MKIKLNEREEARMNKITQMVEKLGWTIPALKRPLNMGSLIPMLRPVLYLGLILMIYGFDV